MGIVKEIAFREIARPLRTLFSTSLGKKRLLHNVLVEVRLESGASGRGEIPTSFAVKHETVPVIGQVLSELRQGLKGIPADESRVRLTALRRTYDYAPMTLSGLEVALFRAWLAHSGIGEHAYWGARSVRIETDITIPFITEKEALDRWLDTAQRRGFTTYKLKVSGDPEQDKRLLSSVYARLARQGAPFLVRLDGNQGFSRKGFLTLMGYIEKEHYKIQLFEQPLPKDDLRGLAYVKARSPVPIVLDETVFTSEDLRRAIDHNLCDGVNVKVAKSGITESAKILQMARNNGVRLMAGCMTETMVGLSAGIYMVSGTGAFDYIDLDGVHFLWHRKQYGDITIEGPEFVIGRERNQNERE